MHLQPVYFQVWTV